MRMRWLFGLGAFVALLGAGAAQADTTKSGASVRIEGARGSVFAAGSRVEIGGDISPGLRPMTGVFAAGGSVTVTASIDGDLAAAGGDVAFSGHAVHLFAAGGNVVVSGRVEDDAMITGANLTVTRQAAITRDLHAAGGSLDVEATIGRDAELAGAFVRFNGVAAGDVEVAGDAIVIGPDARIGGDLTYYSDEPAEISPQAEIVGKITARKAGERDLGWSYAQRAPFAKGDLRARAYGALFWFVAFGASGALMAVLFPRWMGATAAAGRDRPLSSLLTGFAVLIALPVAAVLMMAVVLGIPFGGFMLALYAGLLAISMIGAGLSVGHLLLDRGGAPQAKIALYLVGLALVLIVGAAPAVGGIAGFLAMLLGLGALFRGLWSALRVDAA